MLLYFLGYRLTHSIAPIDPNTIVTLTISHIIYTIVDVLIIIDNGLILILIILLTIHKYAPNSTLIIVIHILIILNGLNIYSIHVYISMNRLVLNIYDSILYIY